MTALVISLVALLAAPVLDRRLREGRLSAALDGFTATIIGGIVLLHVLPHGLQLAGWPALAALGMGLLLPAGCGRIPGGRGLVGVLATLALLAHGLLDGVALASDEGGAGEMLAEAVIVHSLPVGLAIWRMGGAEYGRTYAAFLLVASAVAEAVGFGVAMRLPEGAGLGLALVQCLAAGSLLHVVSHSEHEDNLASGLGALFGVAGMLWLALDHPIPQLVVDELAAGRALLTLTTTSAAALSAAWLVSAAGRWCGLRSEALASIPLALTLLPGWSGQVWALAAVVVAALGGRQEASVSLPEAARDSLERAAPWALFGFGLAALAEPLLPVAAWNPVPAVIFVAIALGEILTVEAVAAVPILAMMLHKGLPPGPAFALLLAALPAGRGARRVAKAVLALVVGLWAGALQAAPPALHDPSGDNPIHRAILVVLGLAAVGALLRQGVGGFLDRILHPDGHADHAEHGHTHA